MRLTRSALRAEAPSTTPIETSDASSVPLPPSPIKERVPLGEVSGNPASDQAELATMAPAKKTKGKAGRKAAKGKKGKKTEVETAVERVEVLEDERQAAGSPASDAAVDELANNAPASESLHV